MLRVKQIKSSIGSNKRQKRTLKALGLKKINDSVIHEDNPVIRGMISKVSHLVEMEEVSGN
ncbi:MAG: 50S ribosomal protein L30 [candidate division WOR-3 bacterium]